MLQRKDNVIQDKTAAYATRIVKLYQYLVKVKHEQTLSKQILRSGTSIGANTAESRNAQSKADFISKLSIALKEASEASYWLELLHESRNIGDAEFDSMSNDVKTIIGTLVNIINKMKAKGKQ